MTFNDLVLEARLLVHDLRDSNGAKITNASVDGIRWTSSSLQTLCRNGVRRLLRTLSSLKKEDELNLAKSVFTRITTDDILAASTTDLYSKISGNSDNAYKILHISQEDKPEIIYKEKSPEEFFDESYRIDTPSLPSRYIYTRIYDKTDKKVITVVLPKIETVDLKVKIIYQVNIDDLLILNETADLPFDEYLDVLFDYIQYEAYIREHNLAQAKEVYDRIKFSIGELANDK